MEYLPKRRWSTLEKKRGNIMIQAIDKQLKERRLMMSLEKFVGGRHYGTDIRQNQRDLPRDIPLDSVEVLRFPDGVLKLKNIKKDDYTRFQHQEQYEHVRPEVTRSQEDDKRLCLVDDLK
ncbi:hypothetical protein Tco_0861460 [Tanacetum coccineum]|uniref:Uncharacterized protein n=1 Tax=Tanacetum coccineum TaxID=301880 RepID=A0ABQ5BLH4_9ASTR